GPTASTRARRSTTARPKRTAIATGGSPAVRSITATAPPRISGAMVISKVPRARRSTAPSISGNSQAENEDYGVQFPRFYAFFREIEVFETFHAPILFGGGEIYVDDGETRTKVKTKAGLWFVLGPGMISRNIPGPAKLPR